MANNRLYLIVPSDDDEPRRVLLAKGGFDGWVVWDVDTLVDRLEAALDGEDLRVASGGRGTTIRIEDENAAPR